MRLLPHLRVFASPWARPFSSIAPPSAFSKLARVPSLSEYERLHSQSLSDPSAFWSREASALTWRKRWDVVDKSDLSVPRVDWFSGGRLNVTESALDAHVSAGYGSAPALTWESDDGNSQTFTFSDVLREVNAAAHVLAAQGVRKGDIVSIYLPMIPAAMFTMLACARLGAAHSVVFAGFSDAALADRIVDGRSSVVVTADAGLRGGRVVELKPAVDRAVDLAAKAGHIVRSVLVTHRAGPGVGAGAPGWVSDRDVDYDAALSAARKKGANFPPVEMAASDPLFVLYTSGSTGKPKGVVHSTGGYAVYARSTLQYIFDARPSIGPRDAARPPDVLFCTADVGWVTGHTYCTYGPLLAGVHSVIFEGVPTYPTHERLWEIVAKHRVTTLYTAPTAIRALMKFGDSPVKKHDLSSLRLLGSVGEPIGEDAWKWYHSVVGGSRCPIIDTYWQTETGGTVLSGLPGATRMKPGAATKPFFGIDAAVVKPDGSPSPRGESGFLIFKRSWPGMASTVLNDHPRFSKTYFSEFPNAYFTGDAAIMDSDGCIKIVGRTDDVLNVSGHRLGTAEVEAAVGGYAGVAESAVVGFPHALKGEGIFVFVILKSGVIASEAVRKDIIAAVRSRIGAIASPDVVLFSPDLPKTRSGKIMRREKSTARHERDSHWKWRVTRRLPPSHRYPIHSSAGMLRKIAAGEKDTSSMGDVTTLADPSILEKLVGARAELVK